MWGSECRPTAIFRRKTTPVSRFSAKTGIGRREKVTSGRVPQEAMAHKIQRRFARSGTGCAAAFPRRAAARKIKKSFFLDFGAVRSSNLLPPRVPSPSGGACPAAPMNIMRSYTFETKRFSHLYDKKAAQRCGKFLFLSNLTSAHPRKRDRKREVPLIGDLSSLENFTDYLPMPSCTATATATVAPTIGLLPMPMRPIISTCAGTEEEPANCASECILPIVSVMP